MAANFIKNPPVALRWLLMDAPEVRVALEKVPWKSPLVPLKVIDSMLRGIAQVAFGNNPLSGLLILVGLFLGDVYSGAGAIVCSLTAILCAKVLRWADDQVAAGHSNFNAVLIGTVSPAVYPKFFHDTPMPPSIWGYLVLASVFTVCVMGGLGRIMARHDIPALTLPFNIAVGTTFVCLKRAGYGDLDMATSTPNPSMEGIMWGQVFRGTFLAAGHVWGVENVACSALVYIALFIFSPTLTLASYMGSTLGSFTGLIVSSAPYDAVYDGVWGYNGFLAAGCVAFFNAPTLRVLLLAAINAIFATCIHAALVPVFAATGLPVFTFPFCLATVLSLAAALAMGPNLKVSNPTFPELHYVNYKQREKAEIDSNSKELDDAATEPMV